MKRLTYFLLFVALCLFGAASAEGSAVVRLNDGAPIPYLDGINSDLIVDADGLRGVTGAIAGAPVLQMGGASCTLQSLTLTDDVLAICFLAEWEEPLSFWAGQMQHGINFMVPYADLTVAGAYLPQLSTMREGWLVNEQAMECLYVQSLSEPLANGAVLTIGGEMTEDGSVVGGFDVTIDRSGVSDPTVAFQPMQSARVAYPLERGSSAVHDCEFVVERVSFTPFGNRLVLNEKTLQDFFAFNNFTLRDDAGKELAMTRYAEMYSFLASAEHPVWMRNEVWFAGGQSARSLTLVPYQYTGANEEIVDTFVPLDSLPASVMLHNGAELQVSDFHMDGNGFEVSILGRGGAYWLRGLADEAGNELKLNYTLGSRFDHATGVRVESGSWSEEYKGRTVPMVTEEELSQVRGILFSYGNPQGVPAEEFAVTVPLS